MSIRRNWFIYLSLILYLAASMLIITFGMTQFQEQSRYPYLVQALLVAVFFGLFILMNVVFFIVTRPRLLKIFAPFSKAKGWLEAIIVVLLLGAGIAIRIYYVRTYPVGMESDYKFYYDVANLIKNGTLQTQSNNEYISLFPHTFGYAFLLSLVLRIFGSYPEVCIYFNIALAALTALFCYGIGRKISGSIAGISALIISFFWPSQIIFSNINGAEAAFTFFLYGAAFLAVSVMKKKECTKASSAVTILLHLLIGILIAMASAIRPMALVFLIALVLCLITMHRKLKYSNINELSLGTIFLSKGIIRAIVVLLGYVLCSQLISAGVSNAIQKDIAGSGALGYSLMVGLNTKSDGGYSEETMNFLYDAYDRTQSANEANQICLNTAIASAKQDPIGTLELLAKKFYLVWSNDDYATTTNIVTMINQKLLTPERESMLHQLADMNNVYYLFMIFLSMVGVIGLLRRDHNAALFAVFFVGIIALHLLVEMQNRYHYYALPCIAILAAVGVSSIYEWNKHAVKEHRKLPSSFLEPVPLAAALMAEDGTGMERLLGEDDKSKDSGSAIDVMKAIEDGHIIITAAKTYEDDMNARKKDTENEDNQVPSSQGIPADNKAIDEAEMKHSLSETEDYEETMAIVDMLLQMENPLPYGDQKEVSIAFSDDLTKEHPRSSVDNSIGVKRLEGANSEAGKPEKRNLEHRKSPIPAVSEGNKRNGTATVRKTLNEDLKKVNHKKSVSSVQGLQDLKKDMVMIGEMIKKINITGQSNRNETRRNPAGNRHNRGEEHTTTGRKPQQVPPNKNRGTRSA